MELKKLIKSDAEVTAINDGAWVGDLPGAQDLRLKVRGMGSPAMRAALIRHRLEARQASNDALTDAQNAQIVALAVADAGLVDWDGLTNDGEPVPYSADLARQWLTSPGGATLLDLVGIAISWLDDRTADFLETATKN